VVGGGGGGGGGVGGGVVHRNYFRCTVHLKGFKLQAELLQRRIYRHLAKSSILGFVLGKF